ncbi:MAG TPA: HD domain-containing protein [Vicinamibacterales bacterium]|jgi:hypothetical protein|nr:HD domain-containing protein [Vicinamibacterales bacterium]
MSVVSERRIGSVRTNRVRDLLFVTLTLVLHGTAFQLWQFGVERVFDVGGVGAMAAGALFPIAVLPMYTRLALGVGPMMVQAVALSAIVHPIPSVLPVFGLQALAASLVGGLRVTHPIKRGSVVQAGALAGVAGAAVFVASTVSSLPPTIVVAGAVGELLGGVLSGALVLALSPMVERIFGHVTPLTLLEALSNDHPLLRRLLTEAPGTFLHSTNVAVMSDVAARAIGADPLTTRVGALYHDVGKVRSPLNFVENQTDGGLRDTLRADERRRALLAHVTEGARLVLAHGLGRRIEEFVREHHGTSEMRSVMDQAAREGSTDIADYRYPGPRPRSRETGVVMIADRLEATARGRRPATPSACLSLAEEVVDQLHGQGQLVHSALSDDDLTRIERALADVLYAIHHHRIGYSEPEPTPPRMRVGVLTSVPAKHHRPVNQ